MTDRAWRQTPVDALVDFESGLDFVALRAYRLSRTRAALKRAGYPACLLFDPVNIRYACGVRRGPLFQMHMPLRYLFIAVEGPVILFGASDVGLETIDECRPGAMIPYLFGGPRTDEAVARCIDEIATLVGRHSGERLLALDRGDPRVFARLATHGITVRDAQEPLEQARAIKSSEEVQCMNYAIAVAEVGMARMREQLTPGMTENELWAELWRTNMAMGGDWIEGRLFASGERTNPWFQECSDRVIRPGELVAFDTDMIGPFGYCADISRTFRAGPGKPTPDQRELYRIAREQLEHNIALLRPGIGFREWSERAWPQPARFAANRYAVLAHGVGLCDEYPAIYYREDWPSLGYDGTVAPHMVLCVESYIGAVGGREGVKLEEQVLVTEDGIERLSHFPFEDELMA
jgi:Xaa-Pro aminopeptidase